MGLGVRSPPCGSFTWSPFPACGYLFLSRLATRPFSVVPARCPRATLRGFCVAAGPLEARHPQTLLADLARCSTLRPSTGAKPQQRSEASCKKCFFMFSGSAAFLGDIKVAYKIPASGRPRAKKSCVAEALPQDFLFGSFLSLSWASMFVEAGSLISLALSSRRQRRRASMIHPLPGAEIIVGLE